MASRFLKYKWTFSWCSSGSCVYQRTFPFLIYVLLHFYAITKIRSRQEIISLNEQLRTLKVRESFLAIKCQIEQSQTSGKIMGGITSLIPYSVTIVIRWYRASSQNRWRYLWCWLVLYQIIFGQIVQESTNCYWCISFVTEMYLEYSTNHWCLSECWSVTRCMKRRGVKTKIGKIWACKIITMLLICNQYSCAEFLLFKLM